MPAFRFAAQKAFLTYSDVCEHITKESIYFDLSERLPILKYALGEEIHPSTGGRHIHCLLEFHRRYDSIDPTTFDVADDEHQHHPNIQTVKRGAANWERVLDYCTKEDPNPLANVELKPTWGELFQKATTEEEYLLLVKTHYPREYALNLQRLEYTAKKTYPTSNARTIDAFSPDFRIIYPPELNLSVPLPGQSTVVVGRPGCGKTTWAKQFCPKPCLWIRHLDCLQHLRPEHQGIIFDDLDFRHLPPQTQKFLVDSTDPSDVHIRYRTALIPSGMTKIFTANEFPFTTDPVHGPAIRRRINLIEIN